MGKKKNSRKEFPQRWCWCSLISLRVVALKASRTIINLSDTKVGACIAKQTQIQKHQNTQIQKNTRRRRTIMCCAIWKQIKQKLRRTIETLCTCYRLTHWPTDPLTTHTDPPDPPNPPRTHTSPDHFSILWSSTLYVQTNYFLKPHDTHYPLTHWPLTHHPHRPTKPNRPDHFFTYDVLHFSNHIFSKS